MRRFSRRAGSEPGAGFAEPFLTAPSPGIIAAAMRNEYYDTMDAYLAALGEALRVEYETIVQHGFLLQIDAPDLAMERHISYQDRPLARFRRLRRSRGCDDQRGARQRAARKSPAACLLGQLRRPARLRRGAAEILPVLQQAQVGGFVLPFANPRHAHEYRALRDLPLEPIRSLSPA